MVDPQAFDPPNSPFQDGAKTLKVLLFQEDNDESTMIWVLYTDMCKP